MPNHLCFLFDETNLCSLSRLLGRHLAKDAALTTAGPVAWLSTVTMLRAKERRLRMLLFPLHVVLYPVVPLLSLVYMIIIYKRWCNTWQRAILLFPCTLVLIFVTPAEIVWAGFAVADLVTLLMRPILGLLRLPCFNSHMPGSHVVMLSADSSPRAVWWSVVCWVSMSRARGRARAFTRLFRCLRKLAVQQEAGRSWHVGQRGCWTWGVGHAREHGACQWSGK